MLFVIVSVKSVKKIARQIIFCKDKPYILKTIKFRFDFKRNIYLQILFFANM